MPQSGPHSDETFRVSALSTRHPTRFALTPDAQARRMLAADLGLVGVKKLSFQGEITPEGKAGWRLTGQLGATVIQSCVVTLAPVTTRIDTPVSRQYVPIDDNYEAGSETEMPDDDTQEPLGTEISPAAVMAEALALAVPDYPKAADATLENAVFAEDGTVPMTDDDVKPFAGLQALRDKMQDKGGD